MSVLVGNWERVKMAVLSEGRKIESWASEQSPILPTACFSEDSYFISVVLSNCAVEIGSGCLAIIVIFRDLKIPAVPRGGIFAKMPADKSASLQQACGGCARCCGSRRCAYLELTNASFLIDESHSLAMKSAVNRPVEAFFESFYHRDDDFYPG